MLRSELASGILLLFLVEKLIEGCVQKERLINKMLN